MDAPQLRFAMKLTYGVGQAAEGLKNDAFGIFILFYYNQVLCLSGTLAGLALGIVLVFDSVSDHWRLRFCPRQRADKAA